VGIPGPTSAADARTRSRCSGALREALAVAPFRIVSLRGGASWNAIPREATAITSLPLEREAAFRAAIEAAAVTIRDAYAKTDPHLAVTVTHVPDANGCMDGRRDFGAARPRRRRAERAARNELRLRRACRDEHIGRRGGHQRRSLQLAQPLALVQRLRAARGHRGARFGRSARRGLVRGRAGRTQAGDPISTRLSSPSPVASTNGSSERH
jgi:hypothetical protein